MVVVGLLNWRKLTNRKHQFRRCHLVDGLQAAGDKQVDFLLSVELGTSACTHNVELSGFVGDWELGRGDVAGFGAGCWFSRIWQNAWSTVFAATELPSARFWLVNAGGSQVLLGVFHFPHSGYGVDVRVRFLHRLFEIWRVLSLRFPRAWRIIAGDVNLPRLFNSEGILSPKGKVELLFASLFFRDLHLANVKHGAAFPTHDRVGFRTRSLLTRGYKWQVLQ